MIRNAVLLDGRECSMLAPVLVAAAQRDLADIEFLTLVKEIDLLGRAWRLSVAANGNGGIAVAENPEPMTHTEDDEGYTLDCEEAAERLGLQPRQVRNLACSGKIAGKKFGRPWRLKLESVERERCARERGAVGTRAA